MGMKHRAQAVLAVLDLVVQTEGMTAPGLVVRAARLRIRSTKGRGVWLPTPSIGGQEPLARPIGSQDPGPPSWMFEQLLIDRLSQCQSIIAVVIQGRPQLPLIHNFVVDIVFEIVNTAMGLLTV